MSCRRMTKMFRLGKLALISLESVSSRPGAHLLLRGSISAAKLIKWNGVFNVNTNTEDVNGTANLVIAWISHVLVIAGDGNTSPKVSRVIAFEDLFQTVSQATIAKDE